MKIILSPSKLQAPSFHPMLPRINPVNMNKTGNLFEGIQDMAYDALGNLFNIKGNLLEETHLLYKDGPKDKGHAVMSYTGIVFKELNIQSYDHRQVTYMQDHLVILSAMYGPLLPHMQISPYRLDMTVKPMNKNLYHYWQPEIDQVFEGHEWIVNLASLEFSKMLKPFKKRMLNIHFKEEQSDGSLKVVTVRAKQARGLMADFMMTHCIEDLEALKTFDEAGYCYREDLSSPLDWYFVKSYEG